MKRTYLLPTALLAANWGGSTDGNWNTGANWATETVSGNGDS